MKFTTWLRQHQSTIGILCNDHTPAQDDKAPLKSRCRIRKQELCSHSQQCIRIADKLLIEEDKQTEHAKACSVDSTTANSARDKGLAHHAKNKGFLTDTAKELIAETVQAPNQKTTQKRWRANILVKMETDDYDQI